ncbi:hypothetical protein D3C72_2489590 [compost metagenome]
MPGQLRRRGFGTGASILSRTHQRDAVPTLGMGDQADDQEPRERNGAESCIEEEDDEQEDCRPWKVQ